MSKEQQELLDEAYVNYIRNFSKYVDSLPENGEVEFIINKDKFINKCKTDSEFSEKWGLTVKERELSLEERKVIAKKVLPILNTFLGNQSEEGWIEQCEKLNIPTRLITITYNNTKIESYEQH